MKRRQLNPEHFPYIEMRLGVSLADGDIALEFLSIDGDYLFEDTLIAKTIAEYSGRGLASDAERRIFKQQVAAARQALVELTGAAAALDMARPQPYLVILSMDGDHMGDVLSSLLDAEQHHNFSLALSDFAREDVHHIIEDEHLGRVVYAGGDDVLALLPIRDALQVAEELRRRFTALIDERKILDIKKSPISVTVSTGLAYVHYTHDLQDAVRAANDAQKHIAKKRYGRNAISVKFLRRSGEPRNMGHKWDVGGQPLVDHVLTVKDAFADGTLSRNLPYDLAQADYSLRGGIVPEEACLAEISRLLKRRVAEDKQDQVPGLLAHIEALAGFKFQYGLPLAQNWLELARFIAQKEQAGGPGMRSARRMYGCSGTASRSLPAKTTVRTACSRPHR